MHISDARMALIEANLIPIEYRGAPLLKAVQDIDFGARSKSLFRFMFKHCDRSIIHWFERAVEINHTQNAMFDEDIVNMARYIANDSRIAGRVHDCEMSDDIVRYAQHIVNMADTYGIDCWWYTI